MPGIVFAYDTIPAMKESSQSEELSHRKWMETLLNGLPCAVIVIELGTAKVLYANSIAAKLISPTSESMEELEDIIKNAEAVRRYESSWRTGLRDSKGIFLNAYDYPSQRVARGEAFVNLEVSWCREDGTEDYYFLVSGNILPPAHDRPSKGVVIFMDITERVLQRNQLKQAITVREDFLSIAAHELRTPITSILLQTQSLIQKLSTNVPTVQELQKRLGSVSRATIKLNNLIDEVLSVSRISKPISTQLQQTDLSEIVRETLTRLDTIALEAHVELRPHYPNGAIRGQWDHIKLDQIVSNLISNAIKYGSGKPVDIYVFHVNGTAALTVRDFGIGVKPEDRARIFQRFERAVSSEEYGGMGLGLWLASQAASTMSGTLTVEDPPDGPGSIFRLTLPI